PDQEEQESIAGETHESVFVTKRCADLSHGSDKHQIEKEFQPTDGLFEAVVSSKTDHDFRELLHARVIAQTADCYKTKQQAGWGEAGLCPSADRAGLIFIETARQIKSDRVQVHA